MPIFEKGINLLAGEHGSGKTFLFKENIINTLIDDDNTNIIILASDENYNDYDGIMYSVMTNDRENLNGTVIDITVENVLSNSISLSFENNKKVVLIKMPTLSHNKEMEQKFCNICLRTVIALASENLIDGRKTALYIDSADTIIHSGISNRNFFARTLKHLKRCSCSAYISVKYGLSDYSKYGVSNIFGIFTDFTYTDFASSEDEEKYYKAVQLYTKFSLKPRKFNRYKIKNAIDFKRGYEEYLKKSEIGTEDDNSRTRLPFGTTETLKEIMD